MCVDNGYWYGRIGGGEVGGVDGAGDVGADVYRKHLLRAVGGRALVRLCEERRRGLRGADGLRGWQAAVEVVGVEVGLGVDVAVELDAEGDDDEAVAPDDLRRQVAARVDDDGGGADHAGAVTGRAADSAVAFAPLSLSKGGGAESKRWMIRALETRA